MTSFFEIIASLCLGTLCVDHVLPVSQPMTQAQCEASAPEVVDRWLTAHEGYSSDGKTCVAVTELQGKAAEVTEISPGQFVHFGAVEDIRPGTLGDVANTGFIIGTDAVAVIDAGTTRLIGEALYLAVRQQTDLPIRWLILTHMHPDHILGSEVFQEAGASLIGSDRLKTAIAIRAESYVANFKRLLGDAVVHGTKVVLPDASVDGTRDIDLGDRVLTLATYPTAHTNNDVTALDHKSNTIWMGDLVFLQHVPALDGSVNGWISVLEDMAKSSVAKIVPGHGRLVALHPDGLLPTRDYLKALRQEVRAALKHGESLQTAIRHVGKDLQSDWQFFDAFNARNATNAYIELEWE
ncbi:quinoprotein relay system zinc metallohydrolase 2 [Sulfitobacter geojensis]|uniref:quinoprotein relay system zinc metallohydrolase 2 n=1 Tax=Sulfitobacter geojensis TaxID=1342299 RepID=UPI0036D8436D